MDLDNEPMDLTQRDGGEEQMEALDLSSKVTIVDCSHWRQNESNIRKRGL